MATKAEKSFKELVAALGCIVDITDQDGNKRRCESPACLHHPRGARFETGTGLKSDWQDLLPLCPTHHQWGGYGLAFHAGKIAWEKKFGTQVELIKKRDLLLNNN